MFLVLQIAAGVWIGLTLTILSFVCYDEIVRHRYPGLRASWVGS